VNQPQSDAELEALRGCVVRGQPYGSKPWVERAAKKLGLESTLRATGWVCTGVRKEKGTGAYIEAWEVTC